ncbi:hypothetical protein [Enterobacter sp. CC120223-11]|uniref:hypothetical protein n=1 Tax=Enterobacter sp. CC120223-11 TaxID=1378073 RepID=UPI000BC77AEA|nr:hypothetical protein [Enterobacter sp. CC120223-11]SNY61942.1 hypothetical protein SAMN02744775_00699 [Enterobacter sp. CC120223-11]
MKIFVTDSEGVLREVEGETVVLELSNGKTIELAEITDWPERQTAITIWGGRQPLESWTEDDRHKTEQLNMSLVAGNCVDVWPGRVKKQN